VALKSSLNIRSIIYNAIIGEELDFAPEFWDCTTCSTCTSRCPKGVQPVDVIVGLRSTQIESGRVQPTIRDTLESVFKYGNPWGRIREKRSDWAKELDIQNIGEGADALWFVGCTPAYDNRVQQIAKSLVRIFNKAGVDFGTLGNEETCCGNEVRRMGEEGLFENLVEDNLKIFRKYQFKQLITTSPHCYNTFKNEYEGLDWDLHHYTQFLSALIEEKRLDFSKELNKTVTYHDPCFLGKQNKVYDEPRSILKAIPGIKFVEFDRSRERSLCCEGGGGRMWVEASKEGERLSEIRIRDAVELGAEILATACPFCLLTLEDAVKTTGNEGKIEVKDIAELVAEVI